MYPLSDISWYLAVDLDLARPRSQRTLVPNEALAVCISLLSLRHGPRRCAGAAAVPTVIRPVRAAATGDVEYEIRPPPAAFTA